MWRDAAFAFYFRKLKGSPGKNVLHRRRKLYIPLTGAQTRFPHRTWHLKRAHQVSEPLLFAQVRLVGRLTSGG